MKFKYFLLIFVITIVLADAAPFNYKRDADAAPAVAFKRDADAAPGVGFKRDADAAPVVYKRDADAAPTLDAPIPPIGGGPAT
ncbi:unnamed protein product [Rhizophagus irregularis]|uniref:Uncharacterized protein n=1 Tax=Rhizophagus irregularis TaxID=588596 RepID=A0A2N1N7T1_9GLOM|nr:hypothetical protein RhiirC2_747546 [Rhizophagus irregularis]CAB4379579.1 unnamed protein product [Rhizophagus irregularis]CAB5336737.1 unnamed protein product [Rhizophagus irregularis]